MYMYLYMNVCICTYMYTVVRRKFGSMSRSSLRVVNGFSARLHRRADGI